jgi:hypothetical protein
MALSTTEARYIATSVASREVMCLRKLVVGIFDQMLETTMIYYNNQSCVKLSKNTVFHDRSKHIEIRYHFIRDLVQRGVVRLWYISTDE